MNNTTHTINPEALLAASVPCSAHEESSNVSNNATCDFRVNSTEYKPVVSRDDSNQSTYYVALDLGGTKIAGAVVCYPGNNQQPHLLQKSSIPTEAHRGGDSVCERLAAFAQKLVQSSPQKPLGIGIGTAGIVNPSDGSIAYANDIMPGWTGQPVQSFVEKACNLPTVVMGDVQAHALGESRWGAARGKQSCLCVAAGTGIGGGYVYEGRVLTGFHGATGHVGHTQSPHALSIPCACGAESHLESVASGTGIKTLFALRFPQRATEVQSGSDVACLAQKGDSDAQCVLREAGLALGEAIGSWVNLLDPEIVVLAGSVLSAGQTWREALDEGFRSQAMPYLAHTPLIEALLKDTAPLVGAAEQIRDHLSRNQSPLKE